MDFSIRNENGKDYREVEELVREAFWNLYFPGCDEHYLVHVMRNHPDFIDYLDFVAIHENKIAGCIMYTKSCVLNEKNDRLDTLTFGPLCVLPEYQRIGIGTALINYTKKIAVKNGFPAIIILGHPHNYCRHGFKCSKDMNVSNAAGKYPFGLLVLELEEGILAGHKWRFFESEVYSIDPSEVKEYDKQFKFKEKKYSYTQEEFSMACRAYIE